ncbi:MAG: hypothetical protein AAGU27_10470, partial [Dehalobacterium sp.]
RYVNKSNKFRQVDFREIFDLIEYVREHDIKFGMLKREIFPPCSIAMRDYTFHYFANDVVLKARRSLTNPWKCQYDAIDRGKGLKMIDKKLVRTER